MPTGKHKGDFFISTILLISIMCITVVLNISIAREVVSFLFLTLVPGIIILKLVGPRDLDLVETVLLSVGLSLAFLMFIGLLINNLCPLIGISEPLSLLPLMITINTAVVLMCLLSYLRSEEGFSAPKDSSLSPSAASFILPVFLSVAGTLVVNTFQNNSVLLLMIMTISALVALSALSEKMVHPKFYPLALLMIAIALLFHRSLFSNYIHGFDIKREYYVFELTKRGSYWNSDLFINPLYSTFNAMLSVTVLPTIYSTLLNVEGTQVLKIIYPLIYSFVPLGLYKLYRTQMGRKTAFISALFFMANLTFLQPTSNSKQMIASLFYVLLFLVLLNKNMKPSLKKVCFVFFAFALVTSHYGTSYIFLFSVFFVWLSKLFLKIKTREITATSVALFFVIAFSWYIYVSASGPFIEFMNVSSHIHSSLFTDFFNPQSRSEYVLRGLGMTTLPSFWHTMGRLFSYVAELLIVIGFATLIAKRKEKNLNQEYDIVLSLNMVMLLMCIAVPYFASTLNMLRLYNILLFFLAPLCVQGSQTLLEILSKLRTERARSLFFISFLIPFFLFQIGFVYEVAGDIPSSISLSTYRTGEEFYNSFGLVHESEVFSARWLSKTDREHAHIFSDYVSRHHVLISYGAINVENIFLLSNTTETMANRTYIYLRRYNVIDGIILTQDEQLNLTEFSDIFNGVNKIYSNGASEIYKDTLD